MKKINCLIFLMSFLGNINAQNNTADSLKHLLSIESDDSSKVNTLVDLSSTYAYSKPDTALLMARQALALAQRINYMEGERSSLIVIGNAYVATGNNPKAL